MDTKLEQQLNRYLDGNLSDEESGELLAWAAESDANAAIFAKDNLVAWCIVPFDAAKRGPAERAAMVKAGELTEEQAKTKMAAIKKTAAKKPATTASK